MIQDVASVLNVVVLVVGYYFLVSSKALLSEPLWG